METVTDHAVNKIERSGETEERERKIRAVDRAD